MHLQPACARGRWLVDWVIVKEDLHLAALDRPSVRTTWFSRTLRRTVCNVRGVYAAVAMASWLPSLLFPGPRQNHEAGRDTVLSSRFLFPRQRPLLCLK